MRHLVNTGTVIQKSRAYYVTLPKLVREQMGLRKGDRVKVVYDAYYSQIIISKEDKNEGRVAFRDNGA